MNYIQLSISPITQEQLEILIAELGEAGFDAFEEEENILHGFIGEDRFEEKKIEDILSSFQLSFSKKIIAQQNWNEEWEKNFQPVSVDDFCTIRAEFHPSSKTAKHDIIITPKMSFGTGHHATTYMMIEAIRDTNVNGKSVLDFGTGTGILAILSAKCGAGTVVAIDHDEWSIKNASENILLNHAGNITVEKRDSTQGLGVFDIILANINKNIIIQNLSCLRQQLTREGVLILSGFLQQDLKDFEQEAEKNNLIIFTPPLKRDNWICLRLKKI